MQINGRLETSLSSETPLTFENTAASGVVGSIAREGHRVIYTPAETLSFVNSILPSNFGKIELGENSVVEYTPPDLSYKLNKPVAIIPSLTEYSVNVPMLTGHVLTSKNELGSETEWSSRFDAKRLFQAYTSGTQIGPNGSVITTWNTSHPRHIDTEKTLNSSHGLVSNQYIISTAGYWRIQSHVVFQNSPGNSASLRSHLRINNSHTTNLIFNDCQLTDATHNPDAQGVTVSAILNLSVGNSVDVYITHFTAMPLANVSKAMFECEYLGSIT